MENVFFQSITDEWGTLLGYAYKQNAMTQDFISSNEKYDHLDLSKHLYFKKIEFDKKDLETVLDDTFRPPKGYRISFVFEECRFRTQHPVSFKNVNIDLQNCQSHTSDLKFEQCYNSTIQITKRSTISIVSLGHCGNADFTAKDIDLLKVKARNVGESQIKLENIKLCGIQVDDSHFSELYITKSEVGNISIQNSEMGYLTLGSVSGKDLNLFKKHKVRKDKGVKFEYESVNILGCNLSNLFISGFESDLLIKHLTIQDTSNVTLNNLKSEHLTLTGTSLSNILVYACRIRNINFQYFKAKENIAFNIGEYGDGYLIMSNTVLKGVEMNPSFLHKFENIEFIDSSIIGITAHNYQMIKPETIRKMKGGYSSKIDFCRELNALMIEQNNKHYATVYRALEHEFRAQDKDTSLSWFDRQVLNLNYWSNVHGTMPQKALFWILLLIVIMFGVINLDLAWQTNLPYTAGFDFLSQNYSYFIKPLTFLTEVEAGYKLFGSDNLIVKFHPITKGCDFLFKILYAYLLYQFIAAFRKFNK